MGDLSMSCSWSLTGQLPGEVHKESKKFWGVDSEHRDVVGIHKCVFQNHSNVELGKDVGSARLNHGKRKPGQTWEHNL